MFRAAPRARYSAPPGPGSKASGRAAAFTDGVAAWQSTDVQISNSEIRSIWEFVKDITPIVD
jgi:hypothetical protein